MKMKAFVSWSGGKESTLSCYKAMDTFELTHLVNMISEDGRRSRSHGLSAALLRIQAGAIGIPIVQKATTWEDYENRFKEALAELKEKGVEAGIFGDIDLEGHREWVERVCGELRIKAVLPLWGRKRDDILEEFIGSGFEAILVAVKADLLGAEWLGRRVDQELLEDMRGLKGIDICGESGEYHTFVLDGPIFQRRIKVLKTKKVQRNGNWFLDISRYILEDK